MDALYGVRFVGPLAPFSRGFAEELARLGFTTFSARGQLGLAAHLSRWLAEAGLGAGALTAPVAEAFVSARRVLGYTAYLTPKALRPLLDYLQGLGVTQRESGVAPATLVEELLEGYRRYLLVERGLGIAVAHGYVDAVRRFVAGCVNADGVTFRPPASGDVTAFMVAESRRITPKTAQRVATALRSLLRYWHLEGLITRALDHAVPKVANRRPALPRPLEPAQVEALLASCDQDSAAGLRDYAMLTLLSRMGLRGGEVAGLRLEDIDWRSGQIMVWGKGNRRDLLPLPVDVGHAVVEYLRAARPGTALDRSVFIRIKAPHQGLTTGGVTQAVAAAARRAGLGTIYAHRLRHSAASWMLAQGAPLVEIGEVLRHQRALTTAVYLKVDTGALRALARPWPGSAS
jgi:integrase/recombinase XerD